jgi:hypothetical protein
MRAMMGIPSPMQMVNTNGLVPRMRLASRSISLREAPTRGDRMLLMTRRSERVPGALEGILSPARHR